MSGVDIFYADTQELKAKAFAMRQEVFVLEQQVAREDEFDQFEPLSRHFVALDDKKNPVGAARWRRTAQGIKLERFAVKKDRRGEGIGSMLVQAVLDDISQQGGNGLLYLHAQLTAVPLYRKFGFKERGELFLECNIWHYSMELKL